MVTGEAIDFAEVPITIVSEIGKVGLWLQALGVVVVLAILFDILAFIYNRKRLREIEVIKKDMARIEGKIDKLTRKR
jgi:biopolymer transport protein ExbB/TolQ